MCKKNRTYIGLFSILLANWWNSYKGVNNEADRYDDCLLLILGRIKSEANKWQLKQVSEMYKKIELRLDYSQFYSLIIYWIAIHFACWLF